MDDLEDDQINQPPPKRVEDDNEEEVIKFEIKKKEKEVKPEIKPEVKPIVPEEEEEEDIDPLDAYMKGIQEEVKKSRTKTVKKNEKDNKVTFVVGIAKQVVKQNKGGTH